VNEPKHISDITVDDLKNNRWCFYHDDKSGYDGFEYLIPNTHPKFDENIIELELAVFKFQSGEEYFGKFDGSKSFSVFLNNEWFSFWHGVRRPLANEISHFADTLKKFGLQLPVTAIAYWSGHTQVLNGLGYYDEMGNEVEIKA
jgi:hypothetical protein